MTGDLEGRLGIRAWDFGFGTTIEDLEGGQIMEIRD